MTCSDGTLARYCVPWTGSTTVPEPIAAKQLELAGIPNPTAGATRMVCAVSFAARVEIDVFDEGGQHVRSPVRADQPAGQHETRWDGLEDAGRAVGTVLYTYRLRASGAEGRTLERPRKIEVVR